MSKTFGQNTEWRQKSQLELPLKAAAGDCWGNTTGSAGKEKMPQLMVFLTKISVDKHCDFRGVFLSLIVIGSVPIIGPKLLKKWLLLCRKKLSRLRINPG
ncbi:MAG TPA: hypothetical protein VNX46_14555 [Candidatus Acidoferrum sp.]|nr:hypothetical protein [Candidatus Acidoferrum sp.]